jgi:hypothetical protein
MPIDNLAECAKPRLLDQVRIAIRTRHYSTATGTMETMGRTQYRARPSIALRSVTNDRRNCIRPYFSRALAKVAVDLLSFLAYATRRKHSA